jgi:soluble lytic murein transglycosylase
MQLLTMVYHQCKIIVSGIILLTSPLIGLSENNILHHQQTSNDQSHAELFLLAEAALQDQQLDKLDQLLPALEHHPLVEYLKRDKFLNQLKSNHDPLELEREIKGFLIKNKNQVVTRKLYRAWLNHLIKTKREQLFLDYYRPHSNTKLKCHYLRLQLSSDPISRDTNTKIKQIWLTGRSLPKICDPLFTLWRERGELTNELIWERMLLAAKAKQNSLVSYLNQLLPRDYHASGKWLANIVRRPMHLQKQKPKNVKLSLAKDIILVALLRLAWQDPELAIKLWKQRDTNLALSLNETEDLKKAISLSLAIQQSNKARDWLDSLNISNDSSIQQWLLSSNIVHNNWYSLYHSLSSKLAPASNSGKLTFWTAISAEKMGLIDGVIPQLESLAKHRSYYGFLAANKLNKPLSLNHFESNVTTEQVNNMAKRPQAKRAFQLFKLKRYALARSEWNDLIRILNKQQLVIAAHLAHRWHWNHQAILAFSRSKQFDDIDKRFPLFQQSDYSKFSKTYQIPSSWAYAITRQESAFKQDATSSAGAHGLMQLKPSTARNVARKNLKGSKIAKLSSRQIAYKKLLHQPQLNIQLGIAHLSQLLNYYNDNVVLATAAYNAGVGTVDQWLKDNHISDSLMWIEQIPYKETRDYVKNVLTYQAIYADRRANEKSFINIINDIDIPVTNTTDSVVSAR